MKGAPWTGQRDPSLVREPGVTVRNGIAADRPKESSDSGNDAGVPRHGQRRQDHLFGRLAPVLKNGQVARPQGLSPAINRKLVCIGRTDSVQGRRFSGGGTRQDRNDGLRPRLGRIDEARFAPRRHSFEIGFQIISSSMEVAVAFVRRIVLHQDTLPRLGKDELRVRRRHDIIPFVPEPAGQAGIADRFASAAAETTGRRQQFQDARFHQKTEFCMADAKVSLGRGGVNQKSGAEKAPAESHLLDADWLRIWSKSQARA